MKSLDMTTPNTQRKSRSGWIADLVLLTAVISGCLAVILASPDFKTPFAASTRTPIGSAPTSASTPVVDTPFTPANKTRLSTACVPIQISPVENQQMDNGRTDYLDNIVWEFDWKKCPDASLYEIYVTQYNAERPLIDVTLSGPPYHYVNSGLYIADKDRTAWLWKVRAQIDGQWGEWSTPMAFNIEAVNTDPAPVTKTVRPGYRLQDPYLGDCNIRPPGSVCISFTDGYVWLIYDQITGSEPAGTFNGKTVIVFHGMKADYYHVLNTSAVKEVPK